MRSTVDDTHVHIVHEKQLQKYLDHYAHQNLKPVGLHRCGGRTFSFRLVSESSQHRVDLEYLNDATARRAGLQFCELKEHAGVLLVITNKRAKPHCPKCPLDATKTAEQYTPLA